MKKYHYYCLPDDGTIARVSEDDGQFEEYDRKKGEWFYNWELYGICSGDVKGIYCETEEEAWRILNLHR